MLLRFIFCFYILFSLDEFFLILFITPVYNFIINRLADESAVLKPLSLHNNRYWSDLPAFQYPCSFVPYNCKVTRRFSAHSSLFQYSTGTSSGLCYHGIIHTKKYRLCCQWIRYHSQSNFSCDIHKVGIINLCIGTCVVKGIEGFCGNPRQKVLI